VFINGGSCGKRPASPYIFDLQGKVHDGENKLTIELYTNAGNIKSQETIFCIPSDVLTAVPYQLVDAMGICGPAQLLELNKKSYKTCKRCQDLIA
jgi:hypothetical protein